MYHWSQANRQNHNRPQPPLKLNAKHNLFKLFMCDTGLLCASCMENVQFDLLSGNVEINMGSILENVMAQHLKSNGFELHYYDSKKYGEVDFLIQNGMEADLIEIKSGNDYKKHNALNRIAHVENWKFKNQYVFCKGNAQRIGDVRYLPWYLIPFYKKEAVGENMIYTIDLSGLQMIQ